MGQYSSNLLAKLRLSNEKPQHRATTGHRVFTRDPFRQVNYISIVYQCANKSWEEKYAQ